MLGTVRSRLQISAFDGGQLALFLLLMGLLAVFIVYPILQVIYVAFTQDGALTADHFLNFFERDLFQEALLNSLFAGLMAVIVGSAIGL
ncbi:MAG: iron ABC transporter permease, partial [Candidatus Latescibacteria bacterium]|nr:iron ABC transporter permease [Candidatus Latescibacterota bacterium]